MIVIENGRLVLPDQIVDGMYLVLEGDRIQSLSPTPPERADRIIDAHGRRALSTSIPTGSSSSSCPGPPPSSTLNWR